MRKGVYDILIYYAVAIVVSRVAIFLIGVPEGQSTAETILITPALFLLVGVGWFAFTLFKVIFLGSSPRTKGQLWANLVALLLIAAYLLLSGMMI